MRSTLLAGTAVLLFLLAVPLQSQPVSWYVDNAATGGANAGTSWPNAWTSFASINWNSVKPGDTIYVSGGSTSQTYTEHVSIGLSGTASLPITILPGQDAGHSGMVIFDFNSEAGASTVPGITVSQSYVTISGGTNRHLTIQNIYNTSNRNNGSAISSSVASPGLIVDNVIFSNVNQAVNVWVGGGPNGVTVRNNVISGVRGDAGIRFCCDATSNRAFDTNQVYGNILETLFSTSANLGPDGVWTVSGTSVHDNQFRATGVSYTPSSQHPDMCQAQGNNIKYYNNTITNIGDSGFDYDGYANPTPHDIWFYNNVYRITGPTGGGWTEYFRMYDSSSTSAISSVTNLKVFNNTFVDDDGGNGPIFRFDFVRGGSSDAPTATGIEVKNNLWYNSGGGSGSSGGVRIAHSNGFTSPAICASGCSFAFDYNIYYQTSGTTNFCLAQDANYTCTNYTTASWLAAFEPHGKNSQPLFVSYSPGNLNNDYHLQSGDSVAHGAGVNLSASYFGVDHDNNPRPTGGAPWDIGAFEVSIAGGLNPCDLTSDGKVDASDVQAAINMALGLAACTADIISPGVCNIVVVQRVVNADLGGACRVGP